MRRFRSRALAGLALLLIFGLSSLALDAQNITGYGWNSYGVLPFRAYDFFVIAKVQDRYVMYYTKQPANNIQGSSIIPGRAFSPDMKNWTPDPNDVCATSGDLCSIGPSRAGVLTLPDGRLRMFLVGGAGLVSAVSSDGVVWTREQGQRFAIDGSSIYERSSTARVVSFVPLPDGSVRMYYSGGISPGTSGTPAYYNSIFASGVVLSALSKDNGLNWVREPGVRINPMVHGPAINLPQRDGSVQTQFDCADFSAVSVKDDGRPVFRIYCSGMNSTVSYVGDDGLTFSLEGQIPADRGDPKAYVLPDGRTWLITNQYPDGIADMLVYGPQSLSLENILADVGAVPAPITGALPFKSVTIGVTGTSKGLVNMEVVAGPGPNCSSPPCLFRPDYYSFSPSSGTPPFTTVLSYTGPSTYSNSILVIHANSADSIAAGAVFCMTQLLDRFDANVFCKKKIPDLPMNRMSFAFPMTGVASSQTSALLSLGGQSYPFTVSSSVPWATVSPANGIAPLPITVKVDPTGLAPGTYYGTVTIQAEGTAEKIAVTAVVSAGPVITSVNNAASAAATIAPNSFVTMFGSGFAISPVVWSPTTALPTNLGGVRVRINGKDAFISYAGPSQLNVLTPPDTASGSVQVEVTTPVGATTANVLMTPVAPGWFAYSVGSNTWLAALFGNTATYVAPAGSLSGITSRSAKVGDFLQLYANGMGATSPPAPPGEVLTQPFPLDDLSRVKVTVGGKPAAVQYAGQVGAGLYQVNVQVPSGIGTGELQVFMFVDGKRTQSGVTLNFQ